MNKKILYIILGLIALSGVFYLTYTSQFSKWKCKLSGGGYWKIRDVCIYPTTDAGKVCNDSSECESFCLAPGGTKGGQKATGKCFEATDANCIKEIKKGIVQEQWCKENIID
jgi:hypothetical protein